MANYIPTIRRRRLGTALRRLRDEAGLTTTEIGDRLGWSHSKVSRIETSRTPVTTVDVANLLAQYEIAGDEAEALLKLAREAKQHGWWHNFSEVLPEWFESYLGFEVEACRISNFEPQVVPGLLQTEQYATAVLGAHALAMTPDEMDRWVALRQARQTRLTEKGEPLQLDVVIGEGALRQLIGGASVMRGQLRQLTALGELPNVTLRVLPFEAGTHPALNGAFVVLEFPDPEDPRIVYLDNLVGSLYLESIREVGLYRLAYQKLQDLALQPDESARLIVKLTEEITPA